MSNIFEIQPGDQDYVPGVWVYITDDGVSEGFLTKFDALSASLGKGGARIVQVHALDITD